MLSVPALREAAQTTMLRPIPIGLGLIAAALTGAACTSGKSPTTVNLSGFPPAFREGYADGCRSAKPGAFKRRNEIRYGQDSQYASGWRDGFDVCSKSPAK
jgi:hypothetical protein